MLHARIWLPTDDKLIYTKGEQELLCFRLLSLENACRNGCCSYRTNMAPNFKRYLNHCKGFPSTVKRIAKDMPNWWAKADDKEQEGRALEDRCLLQSTRTMRQYSNSSFRIKKLLCRKVISSYTKNFFEPVVLQSVKMIRIAIHLNKKRMFQKLPKA